MSIGTRIKMRREELGMTQPELACLIGVSKGSIGNYESGISRPNEDILIKLFSPGISLLSCQLPGIFITSTDSAVINLEDFDFKFFNFF